MQKWSCPQFMEEALCETIAEGQTYTRANPKFKLESDVFSHGVP